MMEFRNQMLAKHLHAMRGFTHIATILHTGVLFLPN